MKAIYAPVVGAAIDEMRIRHPSRLRRLAPGSDTSDIFHDFGLGPRHPLTTLFDDWVFVPINRPCIPAD
jgi:hypothetical protein